MIVGLTGGIGSGKSAAGNEFFKLGMSLTSLRLVPDIDDPTAICARFPQTRWGRGDFVRPKARPAESARRS